MNETRLKAALRFGVFVALYLFFVSVVAWVVAPPAQGLPISPVFRTLLQNVAVGLAAVVLATAFVLRAVEERSLSFVGLGREPGWAREFGSGFLLGLLMIGLIVFLLCASGHLHFSAADVPSREAVRRLAVLLVIFLLGALHEELLFRGYPFQRLVEALGAPLAILLLAALFGAVHSGNPHASVLGAINTALVGVLFALAYLRTARLWLPIGLHWSWNFFEAASGLPVSGITIDQLPWAAQVSGRAVFHGAGYGPEASLPATVVIVAVTVLLLVRNPPAAPSVQTSVHECSPQNPDSSGANGSDRPAAG